MLWMAASISSFQLQGAGSFQACNAAACDQNGLGALGRLHCSGALGLTADSGVPQAGDVGHIQIGKAIQTALIAANAAVDLLYPALPAYDKGWDVFRWRQGLHSVFRRIQKIRTLLLLEKSSDFVVVVHLQGLEPWAH